MSAGGMGALMLEPEVIEQTAHLVMESTVQTGPGRPFGGERDGAPCAYCENLLALAGEVSRREQPRVRRQEDIGDAEGL